jgi:hypothetical protein
VGKRSGYTGLCCNSARIKARIENKSVRIRKEKVLMKKELLAVFSGFPEHHFSEEITKRLRAEHLLVCYNKTRDI